VRANWTLFAIVALGCTNAPPPELLIAGCAQGFENPVSGVSTAGVRYASLDGEPTTVGPSAHEVETARRQLAIVIRDLLADKYPSLRQFELYSSSWALVSDPDGMRLYGFHSRYHFDPSILVVDGGPSLICSWHDRESGQVLKVHIHPGA